MIIECPHCFTFVLPKPHGECPACQCNTRDLRDADEDLASVVISEHSPLPDICCQCGVMTRRVVKVLGSKPVDGFVPAGHTEGRFRPMLVLLHFLFAPVGAIFAHHLNEGPSGWNHVQISMSQCDECAECGPPQPLRVDHEQYTMRFAVHREFAHQFERLNTSHDG
jgi:hypothetical protein